MKRIWCCWIGESWFQFHVARGFWVVYILLIKEWLGCMLVQMCLCIALVWMQRSQISMLVVLHAVKFFPASQLSPSFSLHHPSGHFRKSVWICLILSSIRTWLLQTGSRVGWWFSSSNQALQFLQSWFLCVAQSPRPLALLRRLVLMVVVY